MRKGYINQPRNKQDPYKRPQAELIPIIEESLFSLPSAYSHKVEKGTVVIRYRVSWNDEYLGAVIITPNSAKLVFEAIDNDSGSEKRMEAFTEVQSKLSLAILDYERTMHPATEARVKTQDADSEKQNVTQFIPPPVNFGREIYPGYNCATAKSIADAVVKAWKASQQDATYQTKFKIQLIAHTAHRSPAVVGKYLKVFRAYGTNEIYGIALPRSPDRTVPTKPKRTITNLVK